MLMPRKISRLKASLVFKFYYKTLLREKFTSSQARKMFVDYFVTGHNHTYVASSSVLPKGDSSLLFTTAGMNQFKPLFLYNAEDNASVSNVQELRRAANSQKCIRVGGKHNDLDDVGRDCYHHTFFEMLGNWSFGDYFKKDACEMAWNLLTGPYGIPPERLYVTYFGGNINMGLEADIECKEIWRKIGVTNDRLLPFGMKDNFWDMGETGPCGPCTEIHYSHLPPDEHAAHLVNNGSSNVIELWNLVFIQYCRKLDGNLEKLRQSHVDTGMGLERLTAVLGKNISNYDTDLFQPLFSSIRELCGCYPYTGKFGIDDVHGIDTAYRIIADHARMATISIADGLLPDEIGAGHCLRRVIRRATMASLMSLKAKSTIMSKLVPVVALSLGETYGNIYENLDKIVNVISEEENKFLNIVTTGIKLFKKMLNDVNTTSVFSASKMFELYFVHGVPEELILDLIASKGLTAEIEKFHHLVTEEKLKSRRAYQKHVAMINENQIDLQFLISAGIPTTNDKYKYNSEKLADRFYIPNVDSTIVGIWDGKQFVKESHCSDNNISIITKDTNFYAEAGGQVPDQGSIIAKNRDHRFEVKDVSSTGGYVVHQGRIENGYFSQNDAVTLTVDSAHREGCMRHHTATHLLNSVLRRILGHTEQRSSKVAPDYLRFDFFTATTLSNIQLEDVENKMLEAIQKEFCVQRSVIPFLEAQTLPGFVTVPGETYPRDVAVIKICDQSDRKNVISLEACCGTHLENTKDIHDFVVTSQKSQGQSVRSLRAVVGPQAVQARTNAIKIADELALISSEFKTEEMLNFDLYGYHRRLVDIKDKLFEDDVSVTSKIKLGKSIEDLQKSLVQVTKIQIKNEISETIPTFENEKVVVYLFKTTGQDQVVFSEAIKCYHRKPCFWFVKCRDKLYGRCVVSKDQISDTFNAETWASILINKWAASEGKPSKKSVLQEYSIEINSCDNILKIVENVKQYGNEIFVS